MSVKIDRFDILILRALQKDSSVSQRALAEKVGLSQNACWRRLQLLKDSGVIRGYSLKVDREMLGLNVVVFMLVRTRHHSAEWLERFKGHVRSLPEVVDFFRIAGDYDYMLKVVVGNTRGFDSVYQALIRDIELDAVTSYFAMEAIEEERGLPIGSRTAV